MHHDVRRTLEVRREKKMKAPPASVVRDLIIVMKNVILPILLTLVPIYPSIRSVAFKNACGARRAAWRIITSVEEKERAKGNTQNVRPGSPDHA